LCGWGAFVWEFSFGKGEVVHELLWAFSEGGEFSKGLAEGICPGWLALGGDICGASQCRSSAKSDIPWLNYSDSTN